MIAMEDVSKLVDFAGPGGPLLERLREPIRRALAGRHTHYTVEVDSVGRVGEVLVSITGFRGHVPLFFGSEELEPGYVSNVVRETVARYGL